MKTAKIGDKIHSHGITVEIAKLFYSDCWGDVWDIEFVDTMGNYRHWKQQYDGGYFIPMHNEEEE